MKCDGIHPADSPLQTAGMVNVIFVVYILPAPMINFLLFPKYLTITILFVAPGPKHDQTHNTDIQPRGTVDP